MAAGPDNDRPKDPPVFAVHDGVTYVDPNHERDRADGSARRIPPRRNGAEVVDTNGSWLDVGRAVVHLGGGSSDPQLLPSQARRA